MTRKESPDSLSVTSGVGHRISLAHLLRREDDMNRVAGLRSRVRRGTCRCSRRAGRRTRGFQRRLRGVEVRAAEEDVHVARVPHRGLIDTADPSATAFPPITAYGTPAASSAAEARRKPIADLLHGDSHPFPAGDSRLMSVMTSIYLTY